MIHDILNECLACGGTGVIRTKPRGQARPAVTTCSCPTGRTVAHATAAYAVVEAVATAGRR